MSESPTDALLPDGARSGGARFPGRRRFQTRGLSRAGARFPAGARLRAGARFPTGVRLPAGARPTAAPARRCLARRTAKLFPDEP
ncbi:hypothetical protein [Streptomyces sp. NPDC058861]|uniref:hypothetical protein n=1 Tax=Streptomyces sp. NPDC058861 TaxID=3346653 RepID=UPI0036C7E090